MSKFFRELLIGIAIIILGIWLSVASGYFLFYGLIVAGLFSFILAFVHRNQIKQESKDGEAAVTKFYPTDKPQEKARFIENIDTQETLGVSKQVSITCSRSDQSSRVFLNGVEVGRVEPDAPLVFIVTKKNNVVNISEQYEGICFFHVVAHRRDRWVKSRYRDAVRRGKDRAKYRLGRWNYRNNIEQGTCSCR